MNNKHIIVEKIEDVVEYIKKQKLNRILLQAPNGYKNRLLHIKEKLLETGIIEDIIIDGDSCYGGCDISIHKVSMLDVDVIIHIGHIPFSQIINTNVPIIYLPYYEDFFLSNEIIKKIENLAKEHRIKILYSLQYYPIYKRLIHILRLDSNEKHKYENLITGCEIRPALKRREDFDVYIVISSGIFHALGVSLWTGKKTYLLDVYRNLLIDLDKERRKILSLLYSRIEKAKKARTFGVITVNKPGQFNLSLSREICRELIKFNKKVYHIILTEINNENLSYFIEIDAFIQTGCPRISIDDQLSFSKPVLNYEQYLIMIEKKKFEEVYPL